MSLFPSLPPLEINVDYNIIFAIFLLTLAVSGNFIAESVSCNMRKLLAENIYAKNLIILLIIYFSTVLISEKTITPTEHYKTTFGIWAMFMLFNKMNVHFTILTFIILFSALVCKNWSDYYTAVDKKKYKTQIDKLNNDFKYLLITSGIIVIIGFLFYFKKQYNDHNKNFNILTFIFGRTKCASFIQDL